MSTLDVDFIFYELRRALSKFKKTAPGKDMICDTMLTRLSDFTLGKLLELYNKVWEEGKLPVV